MCFFYREDIVKTQRPQSPANELPEGLFFRKEFDGSQNNRVVPLCEIVHIPTDHLPAQQEVKEVK